ncbi:MAG: polysulfide reductase NrfD [Eggerthellales bacterium]|nr:polysulfide reductase NrfD [Eggerthellales bacterium]
MLSEYVIWYLFVAGTGAGALALAVVLDLAQASRHRLGAVPFESKVGFVSAAALLSLSALLLFLDLGNPGAIAFLFANPFRSMLAAGAWLIALGIAASATLAWMALTCTGTRWLLSALETVALVDAVAVMGYTGVFLSTMPAVDFWFTPWLVALFVASALGCGAAWITLASFMLKGGGGRIAPWAAAALSALEAALLAAFLCSRWLFTPVARQSCTLLLSGDLSGVFWTGLVGVGLAVPLACFLLGRLVRLPGLRMAACAGTLAGGACLRYCVVLAAVYTPIMFPAW